MSLICAGCGKIIVLSQNPDHFGMCAACPPATDDQAKLIHGPNWRDQLPAAADIVQKWQEGPTDGQS